MGGPEKPTVCQYQGNPEEEEDNETIRQDYASLAVESGSAYSSSSELNIPRPRRGNQPCQKGCGHGTSCESTLTLFFSL
jgi:hypothetical protein